MGTQRYDLIVIGAGSAARYGAKKAKEHGAKVALIEHERWGGSCPNVACTPTKAYLVVADLAHKINTLASKIGIEVAPATTNLARVRAWKETLKKPQEKWVEDLRADGFDTFQGTASFVDARTVRVGDAEHNMAVVLRRGEAAGHLVESGAQRRQLVARRRAPPHGKIALADPVCHPR